jgi:hypothetical protein
MGRYYQCGDQVRVDFFVCGENCLGIINYNTNVDLRLRKALQDFKRLLVVVAWHQLEACVLLALGAKANTKPEHCHSTEASKGILKLTPDVGDKGLGLLVNVAGYLLCEYLIGFDLPNERD